MKGIILRTVAGRMKRLRVICHFQVCVVISDQRQGKCEIKANAIKVKFDSVELGIS